MSKQRNCAVVTVGFARLAGDTTEASTATRSAATGLSAVAVTLRMPTLLGQFRY